MDKARFIAGLAEKIGGWTKIITTQLEGPPRGARDWRDNNQNIYVAFGTTCKLYVLAQTDITLNQIEDVTPLRAVVTSTLTNPFDTTITSTTVTVHHTVHGLQTGDYVKLVAGAAVGGLTIAGIYTNIQVSDANTYTIVASSAATSTVSGGGGTVAYSYFRITIANPFTTTAGSNIVTVAHTAHGAMVGDYVTVNGSSAVGGVTPDGEYEIQTVSTNSYTILVSSNASSGASGGGNVNFIYDINCGFADTAFANGYGTGGYGQGGYGTTGTTSVTFQARTWALSHYGQQLLANPYGGTIYVWDPTTGGRAYPLYNAPTNINYMFVTSERFVFALGVSSTGTAMTVAWPDQEDYTDWTSTATNTANEGRTLQEGAYLVGGCTVRDGVSLVFSNDCAYAFTYTGDNSVYATSTQGINAGLIGPLALCVVGGVAYWMGYSELWSWNGNVIPLPSDDIRDFIYRDINVVQAAKFVVGSNIAKKEVWGFYCSADSDEIDRYWIYHIDQSCFSSGTLVRTSWIDRGLFSYPIAADSDGYVYYQEYGNDAYGAAIDSYIEVSPVEVAKGDRSIDVFTLIPDFERQTGQVNFSINSQYYPQETATVYGPYTIEDDASTPRVDLRINGKLIGFKIESNVIGGDFRLGLPRIEAQPAGARR